MRIPTVSHRDPAQVDTAAFDTFLEELERQFPLLHEHLHLTRVHTHGLLLHWRGAADARPVVLMAHLDVVPVEGEWQHPPFCGRDRRRLHLGSRHPGRQGLPGRHLRGRRDPPGARAHPCPGPVALLRLRRGGLRARRAAGRRRAAPARRTPVVRARRGRRDRLRGVPRRGGADRGHRRHREGQHLGRAARGGPRRARLHPGAQRPDRAHRARHHRPGEGPAAGEPAGPHHRALPSAGPARAAPAAPADGPRRPAAPGADPRPARRRPRDRRDGAHHGRRDHAVRLPGAQRHRQHRHAPGSTCA